MLDIIESIRGVIDAPPQVILACPVGVIAALHFAGTSNDPIKGARSDSVVRGARAAAVERPAWLRAVGIGLGLGIAGGSFIYLQDPGFWPSLFSRAPF